jgi:hypothetical protein
MDLRYREKKRLFRLQLACRFSAFISVIITERSDYCTQGEWFSLSYCIFFQSTNTTREGQARKGLTTCCWSKRLTEQQISPFHCSQQWKIFPSDA